MIDRRQPFHEARAGLVRPCEELRQLPYPIVLSYFNVCKYAVSASMSDWLRFKFGMTESGFTAGGFVSQRLRLPSVLVNMPPAMDVRLATCVKFGPTLPCAAVPLIV